MSEKEKPRRAFWIGCGIGCLLLLALMIAAGFVGAHVVKKRYDRWTAEREISGADFVAKGFQKVSGPFIQVSERISVPTVYVGEIVSITADADADVAIVALSAEVRGKIAGNVFFRGLILAVYPGAEIGKDLDVRANFVHLLGDLKGQLRGEYKTLNRTPTKFGLPEKPGEQ